MGKKIKLCLVYRDMWQSSGKYMPRVDQLVKVAGPIVEMGCFARVETNGGGFEQINLLFGENPNKSVRDWTQAFNDAGIQTQMLERGINGLRMRPCSKDLRQLMFKLKKIQGTDISRSFDGLNDTNNLELSIKYAKEGGMIAQAALSITHSRIHTVDYYLKMADTLIEMGADEICVKDMAGVGRPVSIGKIVAGLKKKHPHILVQYHGHSGPGFSVASSLEAARAGADIIDVGMEPLSWGTGHADLLTVHAMLKDAGFELPDINMKAYMKVRSLTQEFIDDFLGYYISPKNRLMNSLLIGPGLPGGMMGSLMADLENNLSGLNKWMLKNNKPEVTQDELLIALFDEVEFIWPKLGFPPLVTPYSQYVKNVALMNVMSVMKGKPRWSMIDDNTWDMLLGKAGKLPGELDEELKAIAIEQGREFFLGNPQDIFPDMLDIARAEMKELGWDTGNDDEELFEYAMHPEQYKAYKSGEAKRKFEADLEERKAEASGSAAVSVPSSNATPDTNVFTPKSMIIDVNGEKYRVKVSYEGQEESVSQGSNGQSKSTEVAAFPQSVEVVLAPIEGNFMLVKEGSEKPVKVGDQIKKGDRIGYIESMKVYNAIQSDKEGKVMEVCANDGAHVDEDDIL
ncbi:MAG: oxaloacetate decarboxylase, partial [Cyclobacteriaceae bacterium]|nr:oxaloacetate decarboxylase [Cyclobacteriaceae bacterium]